MNIIEFASKKNLLEKLAADSASRGDWDAINNHVGLIADVMLKAQADVSEQCEKREIPLCERDRRIYDLRKASISIGRRIVGAAFQAK